MKPIQLFLATAGLVFFSGGVVFAHNPVFSPGPHVLFKEGIEIHVGADRKEAGPAKQSELNLEFTYGLTGDWAAGIGLPYKTNEQNTASSSGVGDALLFSKYRFWRENSLGVQKSAAALFNVMLPSGDDKTMPPLGSGSTDVILGFTYGYESLKWYRWTSIRYRYNGDNSDGLRRGNKWLLDFALGLRSNTPVYLKPDTVWILELNGERGQRTEVNGSSQANTGGTEWFISPGIFWTLRNFAVKTGVQIPITSNLNGNQAESDYRAKLELEWHL